MIVCQCKGTTDTTVKRVIRSGASTLGEIGAACLAGTECGGCHETLIAILRSEQDNASASKDPSPPSLNVPIR